MRCSLLVLLSLLITTPTVSAGELYVASYNVENLFDLEDDEEVDGDEDFTPAGPKKWTEDRRDAKIENLSRAIKQMNEGKGPDVLGLCEIENKTTVEWIVASLASLGRDYKIVHKDSPSDRGIDCAIIYDADAFTLQNEKFHFVDADNTRDIVEAELKHNDKTLFVFMNHWPSRGNPEADRLTAAKVLRTRLNVLLAADSSVDAIILGDLNDTPDDVSVKTQLKTSANASTLPEGYFYNTMWPIHEAAGKGTYVYQNKWQVIDHVIVSPGLLDESGFKWKSGSTKPLSFSFLLFDPPGLNSIPRPNRSYSGNTYHASGTSDHLPVGCVLIAE